MTGYTDHCQKGLAWCILLRRDQHKIADKILLCELSLRRTPGAMEHRLGSGIGAGNGRKLSVVLIALDGKYFARRHYYILGERPVEI